VRHFTVEDDRIDLPRGATARARRVKVGWRGRQVLGLSQGDFRSYIYPVFTPSGAQVTSESPIDHPHHQSVTIGADHLSCYLPYSSDKVEEANYSFYINYVFQGRAPGRIVSRSVEGSEIAPDHLRLTQELDWQGPEEWGAPDRRIVAVETRTIDVRPADGANVIDVRTRLSPTDWALRIGPTRHAFFTVRLADGLRVVDGGSVVDSEGRSGGDAISGQRAAWVDACGQAYKGHRAGIAVFPHASTADSPWGVADYGTITVNPIFESSWELDPGDSVEAGVSLVVHDGSTGDAGIAEKYHSFQRRMM
jgi:hypothetical protein